MSNEGWRRVGAVLCVAFWAVTGHAAVLHVPGDYARIQAAIDAGSNGDLILVDPGVYAENINFKGKALTLSSTNPADLGVVKSTIIRAASRSSVVSFVSGETSNSVLAGFTITGGYGTVNPEIATNIYWGGGIYCVRSSPTIIGNIITANATPIGDSNVAGYGCGIGCLESAALITRNVIAANTGYAGGIMTYLGKARIVSNLICSNSVQVGGGAVLLAGGQLLNNTIVGNAAQAAAGVYAGSDINSPCVISGNIICHGASGGGLYVDDQGGITQVAFNDVWNNTDGDYPGGESRTGLNGNISQDPAFVDAANNDYRLRDTSPCINAGDPAFLAEAGESDLDGNVRVYGGRVDMGAAEYFDNFRPTADAGPGQAIRVTALPLLITLDGSASSDPNGAALSYRWTQFNGPAVSLSSAGTAKPWFSVSKPGTYVFQLVVNNGSFDSFPDVVQIIIQNEAPTANAGEDQRQDEGVAAITLDASRSADPEGLTLSYRWTQVSGWKVRLSDPGAAQPAFLHPWPGVYVFELVVNDGLQDSAPDRVRIVVGPNHAPVANAGLSRYVAAGTTLVLDGTGSYDPDGGSLTYRWRQISGPAITMTGTNTAFPLVSGFLAKTTIQKCVFELVVSDGNLTSAPSTNTVTVVPNYGANALMLVNPPFDPAKPTIVAFGGGNCSTGGSMTFGGVWEAQANWLTVASYAPAYAKYGDMLMVYLSSVAPDYQQPIQTIGFSTGNKPAMEVANYVNATYKDARYAVNRVALLDAVCNNLSTMVAQYQANRIAGEQCWVDNYISNDSAYSRASVIPNAFNIACNPKRSHSYPVQRYASSSLDYQSNGMTGFAYLSVVGTGKNYQLNTATNKYYFNLNSTGALVFFNQTTYPGKILAPVQLAGPAHGSTLATNGAVFSCEPVENAVRYQLLFGSNPDRVMDFAIVSNTTNPPGSTLCSLPLANTWWTVKAYDAYGSTIYAEPRLIRQPENRMPVADAGPDLVLYAGLDGKVTVTLNGSNSTDPDGDALSYTWAGANGATAYLTNALSLTMDLPVGVHTFQLMVNDGQVNSEPDEVTVTVVAPLECQVKVSPSAINPRSSGQHILAQVRFPEGVTKAQLASTEPLRLYPGGLETLRRWNVGREGAPASIFAFFDRDALCDVLDNGPTELTVAGKLASGQWFYGRDTVKVVGEKKNQGK